MSRLRQHRLTLALLFSLLMHLVALGSPGWHVPTLEDVLSSTDVLDAGMERLDARLIVPAPEPMPAADARLSSSVATPKPAGSQRAASIPAIKRPMKPQVVTASAGVLAMPPAPTVDDEQDRMERVQDAPDRASAHGDTELPDAPLALASVNMREPQVAGGRAASTHTGAKNDARSITVPRLQLPLRGHVRFNVTRGEQGFVMGQSVHHWNHDDKSYVLNSVTETTGLVALFRSVRVVWLSQGSLAQDGLHPHEFRTEKEGVRSDAARLDWVAMKLTLMDGNGRARELPLQPGTQDVLSMFYQLGSLVSPMSPMPSVSQENDAQETKNRVAESFYVTTGRKLERYRFDKLGDEVLTLPQRGRQRALHVRTLAGDQTIDVWLAYDLRGLPIRIRYTDGKGDRYDQMADEIEFEDKNAQTQTQNQNQNQNQIQPVGR